MKMNMNVKQLRMPKIKLKIKLDKVLWTVFFAVVLAEAFLLVKTLYLDRPAEPAAVESGSAIKIDEPAFQKAAKWLEDSGKYRLPALPSGRPNPFLEYR